MRRCELLLATFALVGVGLPFACSVNTEGQGSPVDVQAGASGTGGGGTGGTAGAPEDGGDDHAVGGSGGGFPDASVDAPADAPIESCAPKSCSDLAATCGDVSDGCGTLLHCGDCTAPDACHGGVCASVVFVDQTASGNDDGSSWQDAFTTIDKALAVAKPALQIWVAKGTYKRASAASQAVVTLPAGVALYGHFKGSEAGLAERDLASPDETVLDGESSVRVVMAANDARLDGFTLANGSAAQGAGLFAAGVHGLVVSGCRFSGDHSSGSGGAVYASGADLVLADTRVESCQASTVAFGGGIYLINTTATVDHCVVSGNVGGTGGGLYALSSKLTVVGTVFEANQAVYSQSGGGGAFLQSTTGQITSSVFTGNAATKAYGGGLYNETASPAIVNCTFWGNTAGLDALDVFDNVAAVPTIVNSILWSAGTGKVLYDYAGAGPAKTTSSDVRGGWSGTGNIDVDPSFVDAANGDLHLKAGSPCIDAADGASAPAIDAEGKPRYDDPGTANTGAGAVPYADMGAYEYQGP